MYYCVCITPHIDLGSLVDLQGDIINDALSQVEALNQIENDINVSSVVQELNQRYSMVQH